jgi:hypothetical protein
MRFKTVALTAKIQKFQVKGKLISNVDIPEFSYFEARKKAVFLKNWKYTNQYPILPKSGWLP